MDRLGRTMSRANSAISPIACGGCRPSISTPGQRSGSSAASGPSPTIRSLAPSRRAARASVSTPLSSSRRPTQSSARFRSASIRLFRQGVTGLRSTRIASAAAREEGRR